MIAVACRCGGIKTDGKCDRCGVRDREHKQSTKQRGYDSRWKRLSERVRQQRPLCEDCEAQGRTRPATQVHHVETIEDAPHKRLDVGNLVALCEECHAKRHGGTPQ